MATQRTIVLEPGTPLAGRINKPSDAAPGVSFQSLETGTIVDAYTRNSCYRLVVTDPGAGLARVSGGSLFPQSTDVRVEGGTGAGGAFAAGRIGIGLRLELWDGSKRVTTSVVQSLKIVPPCPSTVS